MVLVKDFPHPGCLYAGAIRGGGAGSCELAPVLAGGRQMRLLPLTDIEPNIGVCNANAASLLTKLAPGWRKTGYWRRGGKGDRRLIRHSRRPETREW